MTLPTTFAFGARHYLAGVLSAAFNGGVAGVCGIVGIDGAALAGLTNAEYQSTQLSEYD